MEGVTEQDITRVSWIYQDTPDVLVVVLYIDDQGITVMRVDDEGVLLKEDDVNSCFPLRASLEAMGYYICCEYLPCVFPLVRSKVTSTENTLAIVFVL